MEKNYTIRKAEGFNPYDVLIPQRDEISGEPVTSELTGKVRNYLMVKAQIAWFYTVYPQGAILTVHVERDDGQHQFHARVYADRKDASAATEFNPDAGAIGTGDALRVPACGEKYSAFETAQTMAIGAALTNAGFGAEVEMSLRIEEQQAEPVKTEKKEDLPPVKDAVPAFDVMVAEGAIEDDEIAEVFAEIGVKTPKKPKKKGSRSKTKDSKDPAEEKASEKPENVKEKEPKETSDSVETPAEDKPEPSEKEAEDTTAAVSEAESPDEKAEEPEKLPEKDAEEAAQTEIVLEEADPSDTEQGNKAPSAERIQEAGEYVITADDIEEVPLLGKFIGQKVKEIGDKNIAQMIKLVGDDLTDKLLDALETYIGK